MFSQNVQEEKEDIGEGKDLKMVKGMTLEAGREEGQEKGL